MRIVSAACVVTLCLASFGCGKKKRTVVQQSAKSEKLAKAQVEPVEDVVLDQQTPELEEFAFVDEDKDGNKGYKSASAAAESASSETAELSDIETFDRVHFAFDSDRMLSGQEQVLHNNIEKVRGAVSAGKKVKVKAYCCEIGDDAYNYALSQRRANAIKREMIGHGVPAQSVDAIGYGKECQIAFSNATDRLARIRELAPNRRAEFEVGWEA